MKAIFLALLALALTDTPVTQYMLHRGDYTFMRNLEPEIAHPESGDYLVAIYNGRTYTIRDEATLDRALRALQTSLPSRRAKREAKTAMRQLRREAREAHTDAERARIDAELAAREREFAEANRKAAEAKETSLRELTTIVEQAIKSGLAK
jgi:hypothetical protein